MAVACSSEVLVSGPPAISLTHASHEDALLARHVACCLGSVFGATGLLLQVICSRRSS